MSFLFLLDRKDRRIKVHNGPVYEKAYVHRVLKASNA